MARATYTNETGLVAAMVRALRKEFPGIWVVKIHGGPMQMAGIPDLVCCWKGLFIGLEAKHQKAGESEEHARARATPIQRVVIRQINSAGGFAVVVLTPDEAVDAVRRAEIRALKSWGGKVIPELEETGH